MVRLCDITATKKSAIYSLTKNTDYSNRQIAKMHNVSECTVRRIKSRGLASDSPTIDTAIRAMGDVDENKRFPIERNLY